MPKILLVGNDFRLLGTRAAVLGRTGASVVCGNTVQAPKILSAEKFDLVVLCHTLPVEEVEKTTAIIHRLCPQTKILQVVSDVWRESRYRYKDNGLDATSSAEPNCLIHRAAELLQMMPTADLRG